MGNNNYPSFSFNERCFELIQNVVEDRLTSLNPIKVMNVKETRLLIEMVKEANPLFKDDTKYIIDTIENIANIKVKEEDIIETDEKNSVVTKFYRPLKGTIEIKPGLKYERKWKYGWVEESFPDGIWTNVQEPANMRLYHWYFHHIYDLYLKNEIRVPHEYKFKVGDKVTHILDNSIKGLIKHRLPAGFNWNPSINIDLGKYSETTYLITWEKNNSNKVLLKNWYDESELLKLEAMPMKTKKEKIEETQEEEVEESIIKVLSFEEKRKITDKVMKKKYLIPVKTKKPYITLAQVKVPPGHCDEKTPCAHFYWVKTKRFGSVNDSVNHVVWLHHPNLFNEFGGIIDPKSIIIMSSEPQKSEFEKEGKKIQKKRKKRRKQPAPYTIHSKQTPTKLVCVRHSDTLEVQRISKTKAKQLIKENSKYSYVDKTAWREYMQKIRQDRIDSKPGLRKDMINEHVGHVINRSTRKKALTEAHKKTKEGSKMHQKTHIPIEYKRDIIQKVFNVPIVKEIFERMYFWKKDDNGNRVIDWSRKPYVKIVKKLVGIEEKIVDVILPAKIATKTIYTLKNIGDKAPKISKEKRLERSKLDKEKYLSSKKLMLPKDLKKEFRTLDVTDQKGNPGIGNWKKQLTDIRNDIKAGVKDSIILKKLSEAFNGHSENKTLNFLRYLKITQKKKHRLW